MPSTRSDGASAIEIALKMSAHYWRNAGRPQKARFVGLRGGYHGETVGALAVTDVALFREAYAPLVRAERHACRQPRCARAPRRARRRGRGAPLRRRAARPSSRRTTPRPRR